MSRCMRVMYGIIRSIGSCLYLYGKVRHASYNSRSSGFTTTISNLLLLFHSCIISVYHSSANNFASWNGWWTLTLCLRSVRVGNSQRTTSSNTTTIKARLHFDLEFSLFLLKFKASSLHRADQAQEQWSSSTHESSAFCLCVEKFKWRTDGECEAASIVCTYSSTSQPLFTSDDPRNKGFKVLLA